MGVIEGVRVEGSVVGVGFGAGGVGLGEMFLS